MKCSVKNCTREASPQHNFEMTYEMNGLPIKVGGLLCNECWQQITYGKKEHPQEPEEKETYPCAQCKKKLTEPILFMGKPYCVDCWIKSKPWRHAGFTSDPAKNPFYTDWNTTHQQTYSRARTGCAECGSTPEHVCTHCNKPMCSRCYRKHRQERAFQKCENCQKPCATLTPCPFCEKKLCIDCLALHRAYDEIYGNFSYDARREYGSYSHTDTWADEQAEPFTAEELDRIWEHLTGTRPGSNPFTRKNASGWGTGSDGTSWTHTKTPTGSELPTNSIQAFRILGIAPTADAEKIKKAYITLIRKYHPDTGGDEAKSKQINVARDLAMQYAGKK